MVKLCGDTWYKSKNGNNYWTKGTLREWIGVILFVDSDYVIICLNKEDTTSRNSFCNNRWVFVMRSMSCWWLFVKMYGLPQQVLAHLVMIKIGVLINACQRRTPTPTQTPFFLAWPYTQKKKWCVVSTHQFFGVFTHQFFGVFTHQFFGMFTH
jgi:hypothetical protein